MIELKTEIVDINDLMGRIDVNSEMRWTSPVIAAGTPATSRYGSSSRQRHNRRRVSAHRTTLRAAFPADQRTVEDWFDRPAGTVRGLSFWSYAHGQSS